MNVVFRVDASHEVASGHVSRCLALASSLRKRGVECTFISRDLAGHLFAAVIGAGFEQRTLPEPSEGSPHSAVADDGARLSEEDAQLTIDALNGMRPSWLVVDHYGIDITWESLLRPHVDRMLIIDDLANRGHECDILVDQNFSLRGSDRYADLVSEGTRIFCGPRYAMIQPEFARRRLALGRRGPLGYRAFVSFGGSDRDNLTGLTLEAFDAPELRGFNLDVAIGRHNPHRSRLEQQIEARPGSRAHLAPASLAPLMAQSDLGVGAGGTTTWERLCMNLPSVVVCLAENQRKACESLSAAHAIAYAGFWTDVTAQSLRSTILEVVDTLNAGSASPPEPLVDGLGAQRVAELLAPTPTDALVMRPAAELDVDAYFTWVNDPEVRRHALQSDSISWTEHQRWFLEHLAASDTHMYVLEARRLPVGQVRFDCNANEAVLDYSIDPIARGRGLGTTLVHRGLEYLALVHRGRVTAHVKKSNHASATTLARVGFKLENSSDCGELLQYVRFP